MVSIPPPTHIAIGGPPPTIWTLGPLDRAATAALIAEIEWRIRTESLRPVMHASVTAALAMLYVIDHACSMQVLGLLLDRHATTVRLLPDGLTLTSRRAIQQWATAPAVGATGATVDLALGTCRTCRNAIRVPAPGKAGKRLCKDCWTLAVAAGRQRQIAADLAFITREKAA